MLVLRKRCLTEQGQMADPIVDRSDSRPLQRRQPAGGIDPPSTSTAVRVEFAGPMLKHESLANKEMQRSRLP